jgi:hypothetical protein
MANDVFDHNDDEFIEFTPEPGVKIEDVAPVITKMTKELEMDAEIHFERFTLHVPQAATVKDIVEAYYKVNVQYLPELRPGFKPPERGPRFG